MILAKAVSAIILASALWICPPPAQADEAMTFAVLSSDLRCGACTTVFATGEIVPQTASAFAKFLDTQRLPAGTVIALNSPGGSLMTGIEIGREIRKRRLGTTLLAGAECASACAYVFLGGVSRTVDPKSRLGLHQFSTNAALSDPVSAVQSLVAYVSTYVRESGVSSQLMEIASSIPPDQIRWLTRAELTRLKVVTSTGVATTGAIAPDRSTVAPVRPRTIPPHIDGASAALAAATRGDAIETRVFRDAIDVGEAGPEMVAVPGGSFMMGSPASEALSNADEGPQRRVTVPAFATGKYEVTWTEWDRCVAAGGCASLTSDGYGGGSRPVTNVSWNEAVAYAKWLSNKTGQTYRLLSEAEWEYAARAGTSSAYWWGSSASHEYANYGQDTCCDGIISGSDRWVHMSPAGSFPANNFGLHDMHGNVFEWVQDCYEDSYSSGQPSNGSAYQGGSCSYRVSHGGSWLSNPQFLRSAYRNRLDPTYQLNDLGFRVARTL